MGNPSGVGGGVGGAGSVAGDGPPSVVPGIDDEVLRRFHPNPSDLRGGRVQADTAWVDTLNDRMVILQNTGFIELGVTTGAEAATESVATETKGEWVSEVVQATWEWLKDHLDPDGTPPE